MQIISPDTSADCAALSALGSGGTISAGDVFCHDVFGAVILSKTLPGRKSVKQVKVTNDTVICYAIAYR